LVYVTDTGYFSDEDLSPDEWMPRITSSKAIMTIPDAFGIASPGLFQAPDS
jgi:hypothetical protein